LAPGQWLLTLGGWHEEQWTGDRRELTLAELDAVALNRAASGFPAPADREAAVRAAMSWYNSLGLTTVFDPGGVGVAETSYATLAGMAARRELTLRVLTITGPARRPAGPRPRPPHRPRRRDQGHHPGRHDGRRPGRERLARVAVTVPAWESG
jgi:predicted amidohydrolase YtcJ